MFIPEQTHRLPDKLPFWMYIKSFISIFVVMMIILSAGTVLGRATFKGVAYFYPSLNKEDFK